LAVRETPAADYPASELDFVVVRASRESAGPARQTIQAAWLKTNGFFGDGSSVVVCCSGWHHKGFSGDFLVQPLGFTDRRLVPERGVAHARELVGQRALMVFFCVATLKCAY
jgi:hypothetical protein